MSVQRASLVRPDDWHLHLRDGETLRTTVPHSARVFGRAVAMPNLDPPVTTVEAALAYRSRILAAVPEGMAFEPLMTLYLTDGTPAAEIDRAAERPEIAGVKYYPAGATTNSENGVTAIEKAYPAIERLARTGMPLLVHGEVTDPAADIFDRERMFIDAVLVPLLDRFPELRLVMEHITTREAAAFAAEAPANVAATITAHHLLYSRNDLLAGGIRPHLYCLPVLKRDGHRRALLDAATGGDPKFFLGTDSAPHARGDKESACGCAGVYTAPAAIELYAEAFDRAGALDRLEGFASLHGPAFYGLPANRTRIELRREAWTVPESFPLGGGTVVPARGGETVAWRLASQAPRRSAS